MPYTERDVVVRGAKLHLYEMGAAEQTLVLAHGFTDHGLCWLRLAQELAGSMRVVMYDARGHGRSDPPPAQYTRQDLAEDLVALVKALGIDRPVVMGHSLGADTAAWAGALAPTLFRGIILEDPPWNADLYARHDAERAARADRERSQAEANRQRGVAELEAFIREHSPDWHQLEWRTWAEAKALMHPEAAQIIASPRAPWETLIPRIACPVLLLTGDNDLGALTTPEAAAEVVRLGRDVHHVQISGAGHSLRRDRFEEVLRAVRGFVGGLAS